MDELVPSSRQAPERDQMNLEVAPRAEEDRLMATGAQPVGFPCRRDRFRPCGRRSPCVEFSLSERASLARPASCVERRRRLRHLRCRYRPSSIEAAQSAREHDAPATSCHPYSTISLEPGPLPTPYRWCPGAFTPTELLRAHTSGAAIVKLFPAGVLGRAYVRDVRADARASVAFRRAA